MKRLGNEEIFRHIYDMGWLETMEFVFCDDVVIGYRNDNIVIYYKKHNNVIVWRADR